MQCNAGLHERCFEKKKNEADRSNGIKQMTRKVEQGKETTCRLVQAPSCAKCSFHVVQRRQIDGDVMSVSAQ
jgi:hypothetical protein